MSAHDDDSAVGVLERSTADGGGGRPRDEIAASWRRSSLAGLGRDHFKVPYEPRGEGDSRFTRIAGQVLDQLSQDLSQTPVSLILADHEARVLARVVGETALEGELDRLRLSPGYRWSEQRVGTNAIGTALEDRAPARVAGEEHFAEMLAGFACAAAPVTDPRSGQALGAIGLTTRLEDASALMLPYARRVSRTIEDRLIDDASGADRTLLEHFIRARRRARGPVLALNEHEMVTNAAAARLVQEADHPLLWEWAEHASAAGESLGGRLSLTNGVSIVPRFEPVFSGPDLVGALVRLDSPARRDPAKGRHRRARGQRPAFGWESLTANELGVAELIAGGLTNKEAAVRLFVSPHTIDYHLRSIFQKLGITSRVELARLVTERREVRHSD